MTNEMRIETPLTDEVLAGVHAGDRLFISGTLYTARDAAHARLVKTLDEGKPLPFDLRGQIIYFVGPTPARPGRVIGAAGPTTSYRMDAYSPRLIAQGLKGMIGKGQRAQEVRDAMVKYKAIYCAATGGAAALLSKRIVKAEVIAYEELGPEAIRRLEVKDFPVIVINDIYGSDQYDLARKEYAQPSKYF